MIAAKVAGSAPTAKPPLECVLIKESSMSVLHAPLSAIRNPHCDDVRRFRR